MASESVGQIGLDLVVNQQPFNRQMNNLGNSASKMIGSIAKKIGLALSGAAFASFAKGCINLGSDLSEVQNVVDVTFGSMSSAVDKFASHSIEAFGLSELVTKKYMGTLGAMAKAYGFSTSSVYDMSAALTSLAGDISSFYNISSDEAITKLKSVFTGETESLKELGVVMTQDALDAYALEKGFSKTTSAMTEQEKVLLRLQFVQDKLSDASGDFVRTQDGWANQTRVLSLRFEQLKATLGQGFINVLTPIVRMLNTVIARIQDAADAFKAFTESIWGASDTSSSVGSVSDSIDGIESSASGASDAVKELQKQITGIDELNILTQDDESSSGSSSTVNTDIDESLTNSEIDEKVNNNSLVKLFDKIVEKVEPTKKALQNLWDQGLSPMLGFVATGVEDFYNNFLEPMGSWFLGTGLPQLIDSITSLVKDIDWDRLNSAFAKFWENIQPFAQSVGQGLIDFIEVLSGILGETLAIAADLLADALDFLGNAISKVDPDIAHAVGTAIGVVATSLLIFAGATAVAGIITKIKTSFSNMLTAIGKHPALAAATAAIATVVGVVDWLNSQTYSPEVEKYAESVSNLSDSVSELISTAESDVKNVESTYDGVALITGKYYELADNFDDLTESEKALMKSYAEEIVAKVPELNEHLDSTTGKFDLQKDAVYRTIDAAKAYAMTMAAQDKMVEYAKKQIEVNESIEQGKQKMQEIIDEMKNHIVLSEDGTTCMQHFEGSMDDADFVVQAYTETLRKNGLVISTQLLDDYNLLTSEMDTNYKKQDELNASFESMIEVMSENGAKYDELSGKVKDTSTAVSEGTSEMSEAFDNSIGGMSKILSDFYSDVDSNASKIKSSFSSMASSIASSAMSAMSSISSLNSSVSNATTAMSSTALIGTSLALQAPHLATGGYVKANTPQLAVIGDNKVEGEIVTPESKMAEVMRSVLSEGTSQNESSKEMVDLLKQILSAIFGINITTEVSGRSLVSLLKSETDRAGFSFE